MYRRIVSVQFFLSNQFRRQPLDGIETSKALAGKSDVSLEDCGKIVFVDMNSRTNFGHGHREMCRLSAERTRRLGWIFLGLLCLQVPLSMSGEDEARANYRKVVIPDDVRDAREHWDDDVPTSIPVTSRGERRLAHSNIQRRCFLVAQTAERVFSLFSLPFRSFTKVESVSSDTWTPAKRWWEAICIPLLYGCLDI